MRVAVVERELAVEGSPGDGRGPAVGVRGHALAVMAANRGLAGQGVKADGMG